MLEHGRRKEEPPLLSFFRAVEYYFECSSTIDNRLYPVRPLGAQSSEVARLEIKYDLPL